MRVVKLYNTETKSKLDFEPLDPDHIKVYVCGPTVYNYCHIGNFRPPVVFDVLVRVLRKLYPKVTYVRNITDIDDKINAAAEQQGVSISDITTRFTAAYHEDLAAIGVLPPDVEPKVTGHITEIHNEIQALIDRGHAYVEQGHVLFSVGSFSEYGQLSKRDPEELLAGARIDVAAYKRDAGDFVLWKPSSDDQPGWDSPWGRGRPGWHIECTAMAAAHLGDTIDIHGGGQDLIFPHHENEIAQSKCSHDGANLANYWMHNGYLTVNGEKMSKSLGNFITVHELLEEYPNRGEAIRLALLTSHYKQPADFSREAITQAEKQLCRWYKIVRNSEETKPAKAVLEALRDDLNTPKAIMELNQLAKDSKNAGELKASAKLLGLLLGNAKNWDSTHVLKAGAGKYELTGHDADLLVRRKEAKINKDWAKADEIRDDFDSRGLKLVDNPDGTTSVEKK